MKQSLLDEYKQNKPLLQELEIQVFTELKTLLQQAGIKVHNMTSRLKSEQSLEYKLRRPDRTYTELKQITDLLGLRLITYFEDHIEALAALIEHHFEIDYQRSIDKRKQTDAQQFGYQSLHYICYLKSDSADTEKPSFPFEIQIRTILQHAWAEIEHDLGYKTTARIPQKIRRRFSRIASLLELADDEFLAIRTQIDEYAIKTEERLNKADGKLTLDHVSLKAFLQNPEVISFESRLAQEIGLPLSPEYFYPDYLVHMLQAVNMSDLSRLRQNLLSYQAELLKLIHPYFEFTHKVWNFSGQDIAVFLRGYSLVFLAHYLILQSSPLGLTRLERLTLFYKMIDYPDDESQARRVAEQLIETLQEVGWSHEQNE